MQTPPLVSIVIPVFNDEEWIEAALESCVKQSLNQIEVICVDDASTDSTCDIIERYQQIDPRIQLIRHGQNRSAFQARRAGILAATAPYVLFLDGDDELDPRAAMKAVAKAQATGADLVGLGVAVIGPDGGAVGGYQGRLQPTHKELSGVEIVPGLFPAGQPAHGHLWRYLYGTQLVRDAYARLSADLVLPRVNDLPITFLAVAGAQRYVSIPDRLYKYHFRRGGSGHIVEELSQFEFYAGAINSVDSIAPAVHTLARKSPDPEPLLEAYQSARLSIIANVLGYLLNDVESELYDACLAHLYGLVPESDVVLAAAEFAPNALSLLAQKSKRIELGERPIHNVLLTTKAITTGGVSLVLFAQARFLMDAGYRVTIAARRPGSVLDDFPDGVKFVEVIEPTMSRSLARWAEICKTESIDLVIDHQILYSVDWPAYALMARALGVPTIGWIHNFALRPIYDSKNLLSFITNRINALAFLVTLSPLDVAFWKLRGVSHVAHLPNPPSPMLMEAAAYSVTKPGLDGPLKLIWWGRLEQHTKQVRQLIDVAEQLRKLSVEFRLTIIGPDWPGLSAAQLAAEVGKRGLSDYVDVVGPLRGQALLDAIDAADIFVNTSIIEGYPLTFAEAQARGLPVIMYELSWLTLVKDNEGIVQVPQGDAAELARQIAAIGEDPGRYAHLSKAAVTAAQRALSLDFPQLYRQLVAGELPIEFSPEPTLADAKEIVDWMVFFAERHAGLLDGRSKQQKPRTSKTRAAAAASKEAFAAASVQDSALMTQLRPALLRVYRVAPGLRPAGRQLKRLVPSVLTERRASEPKGSGVRPVRKASN